ncbi:MAG: hypothetical protein L6Q65_05725 [Zoogloea sp.]|nr:hypothetical protein [Zoogloea sp.]
MSTYSAHEAGSLPLQKSVAPELLHAVQVAFPQGYRLPDDCTDPNLIQRYIAAQMGRTVEACLEVGRGLHVLKELCPHGEFMNRVGELGINDRVARRFMAASVRFSNASTLPLLSAVGKQSKLFELLPLDEEQLEELAVKGRVGPLALSEIPAMTVTALRGRVKRCLEERRQVIDALFAEKNKCGVDTAFERPADALQPGDRIESLHARRPGAVVKVYADGSACVCWDDGEPQEAGLGHERMPRNLLVKVASEATPEEGAVNAAFETRSDAVAGDVNDGGTSPTATPEAAPEPGAQAAPAENIRRVDAKLQVHWAGRVFDVSKAGVGVGDDVMCQPAPIPPFLWVRKIDASQREHMATMVEPVEPPPLVSPQAAPPDPALTHRKLYLRERMKVLLRYTDGPELNDIEDLLDELVSDISRGRYVPGLVAADYELTRRFWIEGGAK